MGQGLSVMAGVLVGFSPGLVGGGGSILAVPLLLYVVGYHDPHTVLGTTALAVALTAYVNMLPHWRAGTVRWKPALAFVLPGMLGALAETSLGKMVPGKPQAWINGQVVVGFDCKRVDELLGLSAAWHIKRQPFQR